RAKQLPKNVHFLPNHVDPNEMLGATDVLISDYSSILVDYLTLDRPLVLYVPDLLRYKDERGIYVELDQLPAALCTDLSDVVRAIERGKKPSEYASYSETAEKLLSLQDGNTSSKTIDEIFKDASNKKNHQKQRILLAINALVS